MENNRDENKKIKLKLTLNLKNSPTMALKIWHDSKVLLLDESGVEAQGI